MKFQIPQFIEVEDKIFGPLTFKQFAYVVGGAGLSYIILQLLPTFIALFFIIPVATFALALAFYKVNDKPFIDVVESALKFSVKGRLYLWKKTPNKSIPKQSEEQHEAVSAFVPKISESKLKDIAWSLGVKDSIYAEQHPLAEDR